ncbi:hypothetical protein SJAG_01663 [Schizosaccharomyces japonicus yFS275]|uniref:Uncharacterized protein n=1 Tax=Schizosaccharomyces japonicus (strain yFS275 / FY16936) TaxID=402676 RepID=B6JYK2_SCHJY|nr:hypothetical protein SJAG_01663 [Schizosaccharomyces japonicus yFS275]EEB06620.1 hypothetical protein SJAG_01663 [Schizosaccharomyces japonicus yFS275]
MVVEGDAYLGSLASFIHSNEPRLARLSAQSNSLFSTPLQLQLTPHHLYYLLSSFEEIGVDVGRLDVRMRTLRDDSPQNYESFLNSQCSHNQPVDTDSMSMRSVATMNSIVSSIASFWSLLAFSGGTQEERKRAKRLHNLRYLYSCFTILPALRLSPNKKALPIAGFEEFPFDTAVPLGIFKNLSRLDIVDYDPRRFLGWDFLSQTLKYLNLRQCEVHDLDLVLVDLVLDDADGFRYRSCSSRTGAQANSPNGSPNTNADSDNDQQSPLAARRRTGNISTPTSPTKTFQTHVRKRSCSMDGGKYTHTKSHSTRPRAPSSLSTSSRRRYFSSSSSLRNLATTTSRHTDLPKHAWKQLLYLRCSESHLTSLTSSTLLQLTSLVSLDLSHNQFTSIPESLVSLPNLRSLNMAHNRITSCTNLLYHRLPSLEYLILCGNQMTGLSGLETLTTLRKLDVRDNCLTDPAELRRLTGLSSLQDVYFTPNPFTRTHTSHRVSIFNYFRESPTANEVLLDGRSPSMLEKMYLIDKVQPIADDTIPEPVATPANDTNTPVKTGDAVMYPSNPSHSSVRLKKFGRSRVIELSSPCSCTGVDITLTNRQLCMTVDDASIDPDDPALSPTVGESYRHKLEALRQSAGSQWLQALANENAQRTSGEAANEAFIVK